MADLTRAIRETVDIAADLRAREAALAEAVQSDDEQAILEAARNLFRRDDGGRDRASARVQRRPGRR